MKQLTGEFNITGWDEHTYSERDPGKLTRASVTYDCAGGIAGHGSAEWLMCYREDTTADFVGLQTIEGTLDGRSGSFVVSSVGTFDGTQAGGQWTVLAGSGRGGLAGITGDGAFQAPHGSPASFRLSYELA